MAVITVLAGISPAGLGPDIAGNGVPLVVGATSANNIDFSAPPTTAGFDRRASMHPVSGTGNVNTVTLGIGRRVSATLTSAMTFVHSVGVLECPGGGSIIGAIGDVVTFFKDPTAPNAVSIIGYQHKNGDLLGVRNITVGIPDATQTAAKSTTLELVTLGELGGSAKKGRIQFGHYTNDDGFVNASGNENARWRGLRLSVNGSSFTGGSPDDVGSITEFLLENDFAGGQLPIASIAWNAGTSSTRVTFGAPAWLTSTAYAVDQFVKQSGNTYRCKVAHTSGVFATDLAAVKWVLLFSGDGIINSLSTSGMMAGWGLCISGVTGAGSTLLNKLNVRTHRTNSYHSTDLGYVDLAVNTSGDNYSGLNTTNAKLFEVFNEYWFATNSWRPFYMIANSGGDLAGGYHGGFLNLQVPLRVTTDAKFAGDGNNVIAHLQANSAYGNGAHVLLQNIANLGQATLSLDGGQDGVDRSTWVQSTDNNNGTNDYQFYQLRPKFVPYVLKFKDGGNVGIGVASPVAKLDVGVAAPVWVTATAYTEGQSVQSGTSTYYCLVAHTSGTFATDLAAGKWVLRYSLGLNVAGAGAITSNGSGYTFIITNTGANLALCAASTGGTPQYNKIFGADINTLYSLFAGYVNSTGVDREAIAFNYFTGDGGSGTVGTEARIDTTADSLQLNWGTGAGGSAQRTLIFGTTSITFPAAIVQLVFASDTISLNKPLLVEGSITMDGTANMWNRTTAERDAIVGPVGGAMIYNETTGKLNFFNAVGGVWEAITSVAV